MGKDKRLWRKLVKKLRRKKKRQTVAQSQLSIVPSNEADTLDKDGEDEEKTPDSQNSDAGPGDEFFLSRSEWEGREVEAGLASTVKQIETERLARIEAESQIKIREEWEAKQEQERILKEEKERLEKQLKEKQEAEFTEFLSFLSGDIETPPTKYLLPDAISDDENVCHYFSRTAACRFYDRCTKSHPRPTLSTAILIPNFFSHFKLEQSTRDEYDSDLGLEYEDQELHKEFMDFYEDVVPELRKYGTLVQFKVCCNLEPHLRGNVYVQYRTIQESVEAFRKFNGRFYNGRQLSLQFIKMDSWRSAICGAFLRKACVKGRTCNYLHVFRNPTKEFVRADHDWKDARVESQRRSTSVNVIPPTPPQESASTFNIQNSQAIKLLPISMGESQSECKNQSDTSVGLNVSQGSTGKFSNTNDHVPSDKTHKSSSKSHKRKRSRSSSLISKRRKKDKKAKKKSKKVKKNKKHKKEKHRWRERIDK